MTYRGNIKSASTSLKKAQSDFELQKDKIAQGPNEAAAIQSSLELVESIMDLRRGD